MSHLQIIEELCSICEKQNEIIKAQSSALAQVGTVILEEERTSVHARLNALIGCDEPTLEPNTHAGTEVDDE